MNIFQFSLGEGYSGSAKVALQSTELLQGLGHSITLFVSKNSLTEKRGIEKGLNVISLHDKIKLKILLKEIYPIFNSKNPQIVISHHSLDRKIGLKLKSKYKSKFINIAYRHNITKSAPIIGSILYNVYFDYLIACSKGVADSLLKSGIKKKKIKIIYNGIEIPDNLIAINGNSIRKKYNLNNKIVIGLSTWFHKERKGFDILFEAFSNLGNEFVLFIIGIPAKDQKEVFDYAAEFKIQSSKIIMPGYVDNIWEYYKAMDIFLLPSRSEGFSLSLLEAAASKLPIIASNIPGNKEFILDGKNGLLFNIENSGELLSAIQKLRGNQKLKSELSENAFSSVMNNYLIQNYANNLDEFLKQISK